MYNIRPTTKFQRDLKRVKRRGTQPPDMHVMETIHPGSS